MSATSILSCLLDAPALKRLGETWPEQCVYSHGPRARLPSLFNDALLASIESLTRTYRGTLMESDARAGTRMSPVVDETPDSVFARGVTAYLGDVAGLFADSTALFEQLAEAFGINAGDIRLGAFVSPAGNGASCHYDTLDVISVQLIGNKRFYVSPVKQIAYPYGYQYNPDMPLFDDLYPQISDGFPDYAGQDFEQIDMRPGSVLCMPRGTWHHTRADSDSLALSIVLSPPSEIERLLSQLQATLLQDKAWRKPCYALGKPAQPDYAALSGIVQALARRENDPQSPSRSFGADSRYLRDPTVGVDMQAKNGHTEVTVQGRDNDGKAVTARMAVPPQTAAVLRWLLEQRGPFSVRDAMAAFPALPLDYFRQIFQVASETSLARYLWFDPLTS